MTSMERWAVMLAGAMFHPMRDRRTDPDVRSTPIDSLDFSVRAANCLESDGIATVGDLLDRGPLHVATIRNVGPTTLKEIAGRLREMEIDLSGTGWDRPLR